MTETSLEFRRLCRCGAVLRSNNVTGRCWRCEEKVQQELAKDRRMETGRGKRGRSAWGRR